MDGDEDIVGFASNGVYVSMSDDYNQLFGEDGNDTIEGSGGSDKINGGLGQDILIGGSGADSFDFSSLSDSSISSMDKIEDFEQGLDKIDLSQIDSDISFESLEFSNINGHTIIKDKGSDFAIDLKGQFDMHKADFIF